MSLQIPTVLGSLALGALIASGSSGGARQATPKPQEVTVKLDSGQTIYVQAPITHRNLSIYPIRIALTREPNQAGRYITLDEGLKSGLIEVHELGASAPPPLVRPRPDGGVRPPGGLNQNQRITPVQTEQRGQTVQSTGGADVNRLSIVNKSDRKLLLLAGELVIGGKQDRIVQKDRIIPPSDKPTIVEVFCVEQGRWSGSATHFGAAAIPGGLGGGIADPAVRGTAQASGRQSSVWDEVGKKNRAAGVQPGVTTYQAARASSKNLEQEKPYLEALEKRVPGLDVVGAIVAVNGKLIWLDEFSSPTLFAKYWPKLLRSYVMEAIAARPSPDLESRMLWKVPSPEQAAAYRMDRTGTAKFEGEEGIYKLLRIEGRAHVIYELTDLERQDARVLHMCKMEKK